MAVNLIQPLLALAPPASPPGTQPDPRAGTAQFALMMVVMVVMLYFLMIRPQQKKAKEQAEMMKNLKPGDRVLTNSGIIGSIVTVKEKSITLRSADSKLEFTKSAIAQVLSDSASEA